MKKIENSPFDPFVKWLFPKLVPYVPRWLTANWITFLGVIGSGIGCLLLYLSVHCKPLAYIGIFLVWFHWFADTLDGEVARARGPTNFGYYLDHFGDSISVVFIGIGALSVPGTHILIGQWLVILYLLFIINGLIQTEFTRVIELPAYGPTEIHFTVILLLIAHLFVAYGQPWEIMPALTGTGGLIPEFLGFDSGLSFMDHFGLLVILGMFIMLPLEIIKTARICIKMQKEDGGPKL
jgi:phosphatidylglycerophosphate synthase